MTPRHSYLALPLLLLAACGPAKTDQVSKADDSAKGPVTVAIAPYAGGPLKISNDGVGPITSAVAFDLATLKVLFPKAKVEQAFLQSGEGPTLPIITVEQDNTPLAEIGKRDEGDIAYVRVEAGDARGPGDEQLLAKWGVLGFTANQCRAGEGREVNMTICVRPDAPQVAYVFGVPGWTKPELPPEATLKAKGQLNALIWRPAEGAVVGAA
ncbi:DUF1131 family protein [Caulobacter vibrioides]|uniref:DUF1131 domain-containing protein n=2 Tax=Caulobacter vibrioides TaxID=155892 RepID=Q9AC09_CAUVC|nr:DUF1131 family protein [Caulobacter vibrioides]YP_002515433.1 hypothetical protein CCNA_00058 [Caulobacter vibrioides NA1000]AAK22047.1 hypothetical protein CC_0060 [Caulobacter vibrioides CB15]ACL93525.1 hypothetical protein CCNA_00058 [Caulobacter vibrioides NA1000]ATC26896.1 DUF1131 domain-containing protein [Caulobacter vibrioides]QXZ52154.1 DUF1131 domain-containing protein [Caulobacter vibrioides]